MDKINLHLPNHNKTQHSMNCVHSSWDVLCCHEYSYDIGYWSPISQTSTQKFAHVEYSMHVKAQHIKQFNLLDFQNFAFFNTDYRIKTNLPKSTCQTGSFTWPGPLVIGIFQVLYVLYSVMTEIFTTYNGIIKYDCVCTHLIISPNTSFSHVENWLTEALFGPICFG